MLRTELHIDKIDGVVKILLFDFSVCASEF
jgi:hypothetical protein